MSCWLWGTPKITDFGLAKRLVVAVGQTQTGAVLGTPSYMAPEQAAGRTRELGPATDVYALGALLYECLTGRPPFKAESSFETLQQVLTEEPVPLTRLQPKVPHDLETICLKCLRKECHRRYASAEALADDLHRFLAGEPIRARPVSQVERLWRWCRRNPAVAGLTAMVVLALLAGTAVAGYFAVSARREAAEAKQARGDADARAKEAQAKATAEAEARGVADKRLKEKTYA